MPLTVATLPVKKCSGNDRSHFQNTNIKMIFPLKMARANAEAILNGSALPQAYKNKPHRLRRTCAVMAGVVSFELTARGFGDRCSTS